MLLANTRLTKFREVLQMPLLATEKTATANATDAGTHYYNVTVHVSVCTRTQITGVS